MTELREGRGEKRKETTTGRQMGTQTKKKMKKDDYDKKRINSELQHLYRKIKVLRHQL